MRTSNLKLSIAETELYRSSIAMPSKNSINRPKNKNTARAKAQHKSSVARRKLQTAIIHGKIDSRKVLQKKLRRARHSQTSDSPPQTGIDVEMIDEEPETLDEETDLKIDTRAKKQRRRANTIVKGQEERDQQNQARELKVTGTSSSHGTTLGGPPPQNI